MAERAVALRRHADEVDRLKDLIREIAHRVGGLIEGARSRLADLAGRAQIADDLGRLLHDHPEVAQHLINSGGGLLESLLPGVGRLDPGDGPIDRATTNDAARLLALLLGDSTDVDVNRLDGIAPSDNQGHAPRSLEDLMLSLTGSGSSSTSPAPTT